MSPHGDPRIFAEPGQIVAGYSAAGYSSGVGAALGRAYKSGYRDAEMRATFRHTGIVNAARDAVVEANAVPVWRPLRWWRAHVAVERALAVSEGASKVRLAMINARPADDA